jgi:hypothetical protein
VYGLFDGLGIVGAGEWDWEEGEAGVEEEGARRSEEKEDRESLGLRAVRSVLIRLGLDERVLPPAV